VNDADRSYLAKHILRLCEALHLSDWRIDILTDPCEDDCYASIHPTYGQRQANLNLSTDFRDLDPSRANRSLVHELLHCHAAGVQHHVQDGHFRRLMGDPAYSMWRVGFDQHHEDQIDAVARVLAPFMPPLEWPN
jgi:hypothetical protein